MKVGICPTKFGYSAVCLPPFDGSDWELSTPVELPDDMLLQLRGQVLHRLAEYCADLAEWTGQLPLALMWAAWGIAALAISSLWSYGIKYIGLYFWVRIFFFADGIRLLSQTLFHMKGLLQARRIREKIVQGQWVMTDVEMPHRADDALEFDEREFIEAAIEHHPETKPYYDEMLRKEPPAIFSLAPLGAGGLVRYMFMGRRVPRPICMFELGVLE